ncbi:uncharacterized protein LOC124439213 [Xenia sp. Carnegie-2017]|uniref:uncharacterized protein LOC124439213 n=1 Tax=Xenia sp. Carnegie-2017 TaxID=2897299 RepID=UPI001F048983|nr:uncharacterized protein LOC124439213 [Xenia sp. Carnegie-2017]
MVSPEAVIHSDGNSSSEIDDDVSYPNAEPVIDLNSVGDAWLILFKVHWITFSICFSLLALYNGYQLYKTFRLKSTTRKNYISIVQVLVILFGLTRTLSLSISPYDIMSNTPKRVPYIVPRLLFALGYPCLFSGFTFMYKIFMLLSKVQVMKKNPIGSRVVTVILVLHFLAVISVEFLTRYVKDVEVLLVFCAFYYFFGCLTTALCLLISGRRVLKKERTIRKSLHKFDDSKAHHRVSPNGLTARKKILRITLLTAVFGVLSALSYSYTIVLVIRSVNGDTFFLEPWTWLIVNNFLRIFEFCLAATMSYAVASSYPRNARAAKALYNTKSSYASTISVRGESSL